VPRRSKPLAERLYGSTLNWEGWTFRILSSKRGLRLIDLSARPFPELAKRLGVRILPDDIPNEGVLEQLHDYLRGERRGFDLPLDLRGTPFQLAVWEATRTVPYGETLSYGAVAALVGRPRAARAVGQALSANPIPIVIPCHRIIGASGGLRGFGGGLPLKERLLALEKGALSL